MRTFALVACLSAGAMFSSAAAAAPMSRVEICHLDGAGTFRVIELNGNAVDAHLSGHGDALPATWWVDADGDGYGDASEPTDRCPQAGMVANGDDCDDTDAEIHPGAVEVPYDGVDSDCASATADDDLDGDGFPLGEDCNDRDPATHPDAVEVPYDAVDNDCDVMTPDDDIDGDGFATFEGDCNDANDAVHPAAQDVCGDSMDNDCDAAIDQGCAGAEECPCFTSELLRAQYDEWLANRFGNSYAACTASATDQVGSDYDDTTLIFHSYLYDGTGNGEEDYNYFVSFAIEYDSSEGYAFCRGESLSYSQTTGETPERQRDFASFAYLDQTQHAACEGLLVEMASEVDLVCAQYSN